MKIRIRKIGLSIFIASIVVLLCNSVSTAGYDAGVHEAQKKLNILGYDPGPSDGFWGEKTKAAVEQFQKANHIDVTRKLDDATREKLGIGDGNASVSSAGDRSENPDVDKIYLVSALIRDIFIQELERAFMGSTIVVDSDHSIEIKLIDPGEKEYSTAFDHEGTPVNVRNGVIRVSDVSGETMNKESDGIKVGKALLVTERRLGIQSGDLQFGAIFFVDGYNIQFSEGVTMIFNDLKGHPKFSQGSECTVNDKKYGYQNGVWEVILKTTN